MSQTVTRKQASFDAPTVAAIKADPTRGMFFVLMSALGITLADAFTVFTEMMFAQNVGAIAMCLAASMQIRANVVIVGNDAFGMALAWPQLVIKGVREGLTDTWNFGFLRVIGHICFLCATKGTDEKGVMLSRAFLNKAGDCVFNTNPVGSVAGKINTELSASWSAGDKSDLRTFLDSSSVLLQQSCKIVASAPAFSKEFQQLVKDLELDLAPATWAMAQLGDRKVAAIDDE
jgi:hypothetical protein